MRMFFLFCCHFIFSIGYCQNNLNSIDWQNIIKSESISENSQKTLKDFLKPKISEGKFEFDTTYNIKSSIFLSLLRVEESDFSFNPKETEIFFLLFDSEYKFLEFTSRRLTYTIIPEDGHVSIDSEVKFHKNKIEIIEDWYSTYQSEMENSPKVISESKKKTNYNIENGKIYLDKTIVLESKSYVTDNELKKLETLSKSELRILRNYYFAKHGYKFKSEDLTEFFNENLNYYEPKFENVDDKLTELDKFLIQYILELEKK